MNATSLIQVQYGGILRAIDFRHCNNKAVWRPVTNNIGSISEEVETLASPTLQHEEPYFQAEIEVMSNTVTYLGVCEYRQGVDWRMDLLTNCIH
jgi:hypothetical protein